MSTNKLIKTEKRADGFVYEVTPEGKQCQFLQFLINTSNMTWRKPLEETTYFEGLANNLHLVSKLCAIGYLFEPIKDPSFARSIVAINESEGTSGGTGKSLFCNVVSHVISGVQISGHRRSLQEDSFIWDEVTPGTKLVVFDDLSSQINLDFLFHHITGDWIVNHRFQKKVRIPYSQSPKLLINKENSFSDKSPSTNRRLWYIHFSDFYNRDHQPYQDSGSLFIEGWDRRQYSLLNKLIIECMQIYQEFGYVSPPLK